LTLCVATTLAGCCTNTSAPHSHSLTSRGARAPDDPLTSNAPPATISSLGQPAAQVREAHVLAEPRNAQNRVLGTHRRDLLGGLLHEYEAAA
jgi:hypothetical protein